MKKKSLLALLLACSLTFGTAAMTGCNIIGGNPDSGDGSHITGDGENKDVAVTGVTVSPKSVKLAKGANRSIIAIVAPSNATNKTVTWSSDDESVATVDQSGKVTAVAKGTAVITATTADGNKTDSCTVTVEDDSEDTSVAVTGVTLSPKTATLTAGNTTTLNATVAPSGATNKKVVWSSGNEAVATVDQTGKVTAVKAGNATITVTTEDGGYSDTCAVTVQGAAQNVPVSSISLAASNVTLDLNGQKTRQFSPQVAPANATNKAVKWSSSNSSVVSVDQNGLATAVAVGTATITATAKDGSGVNGSCSVTVINSTPVPATKYSVKFYSDGVLKETQQVEDGQWATMPSNITKEGYYLAGWGTSSVTGANYDFTKPVKGELVLHAKWEQVSANISYTFAGYECAAFEWGDGNPSTATVEYKLHSANSYTTVDSQLVRASKTAGVARVDVVGLKGGANYDFKITTSAGNTMTVNNMTIASYDRSGYAHFKYTSGVGGYNDDGTPKNKANIVYFTEDNKNATVTVEGKSCAGIVGVLTTKFTNPLIVRIIGTVGAATWKKGVIDYGVGVATPKDKVLLKDGKTKLSDFVSQHSNEDPLSQETLAKYGANELDTSQYAVLKGLSSKIISSSKEYDSCWNDCSISGVKNVTVEGIGEDARIFQWGMTFKNSNSIEVRNLTFEDYTEDACSFEGGSSNTSSTSADDFTYKNYWVHHNVFEEGVNYWDVCSEQDKHDGDGSTDIKRVSYVTFAYNVYHNTHKTGLVGSDDSVNTAAVTFHHNYYNGCKARLPLARKANMHMYNNYYFGTTSTSLSLRGDAYAFVENCYFNNNGSGYDIELQHNETEGDGSAKVLNCVFDNKRLKKSSVDSNHYLETTSRTATVTTTNKFGGGNGANFDLNSNLFYYDGEKTIVQVPMLTAQQVKTEVPKLAGVQKRGSSTGGTGSGSDEHQHTYSDTYTSAGASGHYKMATCQHTSEHTALEAHVYDNNTDTTCNECNYVRTIGGSGEETAGNILLKSSVSSGASLVSENDGITATANGSYTLEDNQSATAGDNTAFTYRLFPSGGRTITVTAKKSVTVVVYYTVMNKSYAPQNNEVTATIKNSDGSTKEVKTSTENERVADTAYKMTITLQAGESFDLGAATNRIVLYGIFIG